MGRLMILERYTPKKFQQLKQCIKVTFYETTLFFILYVVTFI